MKCDDCKYAEWHRTANGRLHPGKGGKCKFSKDVHAPQSSPRWGLNQNDQKEGIFEVRGGFIERGNVFDRCAYYGPVMK